MKLEHYFSPSIGDNTRALFSLDKCRFLFHCTPLRSRPLIYKSVLDCSCGLPLFYLATPKETVFYGCFCLNCSLEDIPCLD